MRGDHKETRRASKGGREPALMGLSSRNRSRSAGDGCRIAAEKTSAIEESAVDKPPPEEARILRQFA